MSNLILYHANCDDGLGAALQAWRAFHGEGRYLPVKYGEALPLEQAARAEHVYVLDFSYPPAQLRELAEVAGQVVQLDHHVSALRMWRKELGQDDDNSPVLLHYDENLNVYFDMRRSGASLAWLYFFGDLGASWESQRRSVPWLVQYLEDRDLWKKELPRSEEFTYRLRAEPSSLQRWSQLTDQMEALTFRQNWIYEGEVVKQYYTQQLEFLLSSVGPGRKVWLEGHRGLIINAPSMFASEAANLLAQRAAFGATWYADSDGWALVSLRSTENGADVSKLAEKMGGGGHKRAAGFRISFNALLEWLAQPAA